MNRTGVPWRYLPHDYPHWNTVNACFARGQEEGVFVQFNSLLRRQVCSQEGREEELSACVIDSQSIKTSSSVPARGQGIDPGKKIVGRKRSIVVDTVGLLLATVVSAASVQDSIAGQALIGKVAVEHPTVRKSWADGGNRQRLVEHAAALGIDMHIVRRDRTTRGFAVLPCRWTVCRRAGRCLVLPSKWSGRTRSWLRLSTAAVGTFWSLCSFGSMVWENGRSGVVSASGRSHEETSGAGTSRPSAACGIGSSAKAR